jgi:hypothetical protein
MMKGEMISYPLPQGYGTFYRPHRGLLTVVWLLYDQG